MQPYFELPMNTLNPISLISPIHSISPINPRNPKPPPSCWALDWSLKDSSLGPCLLPFLEFLVVEVQSDPRVLGFWVQGLVRRVLGLGLRVLGLGIQGFGFSVLGLQLPK